MDPLFRKSMVSQLAENLSASQSLAERLADMRSPLERLGKSSVADILGIDREPARLVQPPIIESPMKLTNDLLNDVRADIADMRELAVETAEMQRSLNDVARSILTEFTVGAADSRAAAEKTLKIAKFGLWIAGVSALLAAAAIFVSLWTGGPDPQELQVNRKQLEATQQQVQLLREERQAAERQIQLLRENRTALGELATRLPEPKSRTRKGQTRD
jgi:cell division protein FtsB